MRKKLFTMAIFISFSACAFAEVILAPQWSEFCPPSYLTVSPTVKTKDKKYWYERRVQFEASLARCTGYKGQDLKSCYEQVTISEQNKNRVWDMKVQQQYADLDRLEARNRQNNQYNLIRDVVNAIAH